MKTRYCIWCNTPITHSAHALYCPKCRVAARKETFKRTEEKRKIKRRLKREYKKYGTGEPKPLAEINFNPAALRWKQMSWKELTAECARFHLSYGQSQVMAYNGTLPENWGLST